ncbi:RING finger protein 24 [Strongylocentrotus purpuratus]|uniref:RING-type domain-containing protein n=1 Tax=Strongylocentrotus purpuratus TaxID=7668 RepID=A0A7M7GFT6_STRPU|nr:RING finger protein 24 [Strongylocentrotus purpuratus]XP_003724489.1 RING finger protein 24 [Strongylocentrotus purpuratus]|eukprot:XP_003724488.1 PREDICTED: RING finger protein 24 [Strongylocentrotus purpuratus]
MGMSIEQLFPFLLVAGIIFILNIVFCCYLSKLRREGQFEMGYKQVEYSKKMTNDACAVCLEEFILGERVGQCPCKHNFHTVCVSRWLDSHETCPICQTRVRPSRETERTRLVSVDT